MIQSVLPQLSFSFYRHQPIRADFSGGQITSDAGLLPLRAFDQRHHLTRDWAAQLSDPRQHDRLRHAPSSSKSALASATPPAAAASISPAAGPFRICSAPPPSPSTAVDPFPYFPTQLPVAGSGGAVFKILSLKVATPNRPSPYS
ncbi:MAG: transposase [Acidobacteriia bacterium]|nr:transposase [Terriglobia bacterium]